MRHHNNTRKFGRDKTQKRALLNSLALNLIVREKIKTTEPKAKELRPFIEKLVTRAKANTPAGRRTIASKLSNHGKEVKNFSMSSHQNMLTKKADTPEFLKLGARKSDGAPMAIIEFV